MLTTDEILMFLQFLSEKHTEHNFGYSDDSKIGALQAKLSIMLQVARESEERRARA